MTVRILALGEVMLELSHRTDTELVLAVGGDTFNTAAHMARLLDDASVSYFTALGAGWYADFVRQHVVAAGVRPILVPTDGVPGAYLIRADGAGERTFTHYRTASAARQMLRGTGPDLLAAACAGADLVHLSSISLQVLDIDDRARLADILDDARTAGTRVSLDTNYRISGWASAATARDVVDTFAQRADIVLPSLDDERSLRGLDDPLEVALHYLESGAREVVVKDGTSPTTLVCPGGSRQLTVETPALAVDTTGAGDAFDAGYLAARLSGREPVGAVRAGHAMAGRTVTHAGALPPRPSSPS